MTEILKVYEYGNPGLLGSVDYDDYRLALLMAGDNLIFFWNNRVKYYFRRSENQSLFKKGSKFKLVSPSKSSVLQNALLKPTINARNMGILGLKNVVKKNPNGTSVQLIKALSHGVPGRDGMHYDPFSGVMEKGGKWKGFSAEYWRRWDTVFTNRCREESDRIAGYVADIKGAGYEDKEGHAFSNSGEVVKAYLNRGVESTRSLTRF
ncbi:MAG: hypothetical protein M0R80_09950 [Proteobacteria bacterium]|jgi:hypothetical protein|nr:hypothetical protein [Pseudomonadota bacterium]